LLFYIVKLCFKRLEHICAFISTHWSTLWFSNHKNPSIGREYVAELQTHTNWNKALESFKRNWNFEESILDVVRSNLVAERAINTFQNILPKCKSIESANLKFLLSNKF